MEGIQKFIWTSTIIAPPVTFLAEIFRFNVRRLPGSENLFPGKDDKYLLGIIGITLLSHVLSSRFSKNKVMANLTVLSIGVVTLYELPALLGEKVIDSGDMKIFAATIVLATLSKYLFP